MVLAALVSNLVVLGAARARAAQSEHPAADKCDLFRTTVPDSRTSACVRCHDGAMAAVGFNHPVDVDYADAVARLPRMRLRSAGEVVARGVFLPDGEIRCVTCHDGRSREPYAIAVPVSPGAESAPASSDGYAPSETGAPRDPSKGITDYNTALCLACHVFE